MDQNHFSVILSLKVSPIQKLLLHFLLERLLYDFAMLKKRVASCHQSQKRGALEICKLKIIKNNLVVSRGKK